MNETIWNYINKSVDNHQIMPSWYEISEALEHEISLDEFDEIHTTATDYIALHDLSEIDMQYTGEPRRRELIVR